MTSEYTLFLDESECNKSGLFCIAGCIIKNIDIGYIDTEINEIKKIIWSQDEISKFNPILHSTELNFIHNNRKNPNIDRCTKEAYRALSSKDHKDISKIYKDIYNKLSFLIKSKNIITLCCIIDKKKFKDYYEVSSYQRLLDDWYDIAMQKILESYTHFLCKVKGVGSVIYEARNVPSNKQSSSLDNKMIHNYCKFKVNGKGVEYLTNRTIYEHIRFLNIVTKSENSSGLQLADFIAFNYIKWFKYSENDRTDFMKKIHLAAYNGCHNLPSEDFRECFGVRILPQDFLEVQKMKTELKKIKKYNKNLKRGTKILDKKLKKIIMEKRDLQEKYNELLEKL